MLYVLNKVYCADKLETYLLRAGHKSKLLFIEDAVYLAKSGSQTAAKINKYRGEMEIYTLASDLAARGLSEKELEPGVRAIDYSDFVELTVENKDLQFWF